MILLLDVGNTRVKWAVQADPDAGMEPGGDWLARGALPLLEIARLPEQWTGMAPRWVGVSCVAGAPVRAVLEAVLNNLGAPVYWLRSTAEGFGIRNGYDRPEQLGSDRFASLVACQALGLSPCVVASAGTALTVDALTGDGQYLGGVILPGVALMLAALRAGTAGVSVDTNAVTLPLAASTTAFPTCTASGVESGIRMAVAGAIGDMHARLSGRLAHAVRLVLTGGDAARLRQSLPIPAEVRDDLVIVGLSHIARALDAAPAKRAGNE